MEGPSFSLRPATHDDLDRLVAIEEKIQTAPWTRANFEAELAKGYSQVLIATDDETDSQIGAYIVFWILFDECQILNLGVDLSYRSMGFAKMMVRAAVKAAVNKNLKRCTLDVRKTNLPAIQLYQSLGYSITAVRKSFYSNGEDAYQMALALDGAGVEF